MTRFGTTAELALEDLSKVRSGELDPSSWVETHGERLAHELEKADEVVRAATANTVTALKAVEAGGNVMIELKEALGSFSKATGWRSYRVVGYTPTRWKHVAILIRQLELGLIRFFGEATRHLTKNKVSSPSSSCRAARLPVRTASQRKAAAEILRSAVEAADRPGVSGDVLDRYREVLTRAREKLLAVDLENEPTDGTEN